MKWLRNIFKKDDWLTVWSKGNPNHWYEVRYSPKRNEYRLFMSSGARRSVYYADAIETLNEFRRPHVVGAGEIVKFNKTISN